MSKLVTVFGASGLVGRHTVRALAKADWRIRAVCRHPNLANYLLPAGHVGQIQLFKGNVTDDASVAAALAGADVAVNQTGILFSRGGQNFEAIHADAARRIGRCAREAGVEALVHISAIGADIEAGSSYAQSKGRGEKVLREEFPDATILRPSLVFGPEDAFFNKFAWLARISPVLPLIGGGHTKFQPVFVGDVAAAILRCIDDKAAVGKTYELGGPTVYSFKEMLQFILRETGRKRLLVPWPFFLASINAFFLQMPSLLLPIAPLLTVDQVRLLKSDNVVRDGALTFADLGIAPDAMEAVVPGYLWRFRAKGQFHEIAGAVSD
ncbi:MAG: complex I NDUFA9 subunit family protein [Alphaproteobacteria bacterium]|nr:complex I NDUFA9 subunit family protein [Alphaproteobacteria bacterium]MDE2630884.1 complex I NDUFA9 subunit family protein [Alphaproteobacteria bacterium]